MKSMSGRLYKFERLLKGLEVSDLVNLDCHKKEKVHLNIADLDLLNAYKENLANARDVLKGLVVI